MEREPIDLLAHLNNKAHSLFDDEVSQVHFRDHAIYVSGRTDDAEIHAIKRLIRDEPAIFIHVDFVEPNFRPMRFKVVANAIYSNTSQSSALEPATVGDMVYLDCLLIQFEASAALTQQLIRAHS